MRSLLFISLSILCLFARSEKEFDLTSVELNNAKVIVLDRVQSEKLLISLNASPNKRLYKLMKRLKKNEKLTAAILAFPLPFGFTGLHRIYLGTKPYVPLVYISTLGGCFGILPLVDFIIILKTKDIETLRNEPKVFMFAK